MKLTVSKFKFYSGDRVVKVKVDNDHGVVSFNYKGLPKHQVDINYTDISEMAENYFKGGDAIEVLCIIFSVLNDYYKVKIMKKIPETASYYHSFIGALISPSVSYHKHYIYRSEQSHYYYALKPNGSMGMQHLSLKYLLDKIEKGVYV